jgi:ABC-type nitrate/sulfonate/bicarbonate transport system substrate-binding protein
VKFKSLHILILLAIFLAACGPSTPAPIFPDAPTEVAVNSPTENAIPTEAPITAISMDPVTIKFGLFPYSAYTPVYIADKEGFFAEQGITIEFVPFNKSPENLTALASGQIDATAGILDVSALNAIIQGVNIKFVADEGFVDPQATCAYTTWVVRKDLLTSGALDDLANLAGKKIVLTEASLSEYSMDLLLEQANLSQDSIETETLPAQNRIEAVTNSAVAISNMGEPWVTRALATGQLETWQPWNSYMPDQQFGLYLFGPTILDGKQDVGKRFMVALLKGIQQYNQGKTDRNVELMAELTKSDPTEIRQSCWQSYRKDGNINVQSILDFQKWAFDKGYMDKILTEADLWDSQFIDHANQILK